MRELRKTEGKKTKGKIEGRAMGEGERWGEEGREGGEARVVGKRVVEREGFIGWGGRTQTLGKH